MYYRSSLKGLLWMTLQINIQRSGGRHVTHPGMYTYNYNYMMTGQEVAVLARAALPVNNKSLIILTGTDGLFEQLTYHNHSFHVTF